MSKSNIKRAVKLAGGVSAMARALAVSRPTIYLWMRRGFPPAEYCLGIERVTGAQVSRYQLRPDIYPHSDL